MTLKLIGEIIGFVAVAESAFIFISRKRSRILKLKMLSSVLWSFSYFLQGAISGGGNCVFAIFREFVCLNREKKKWAARKIWLPLLILGTMVPSVIDICMNGFMFRMLLPMTGSSMAVLGNYNRNPLILKWFSIVANGLYLIYGILINSVSVVLCDTILILSAVIGIIREHTKKKVQSEGKIEEIQTESEGGKAE